MKLIVTVLSLCPVCPIVVDYDLEILKIMMPDEEAAIFIDSDMQELMEEQDSDLGEREVYNVGLEYRDRKITGNAPFVLFAYLFALAIYGLVALLGRMSGRQAYDLNL